jgi:serine/threonine protein kinase
VHRVEKDGESFALKIVAPEARADTATMDHFLRETDCLQSLRHPHLVQVIDAGFFCGAPFCVMEFVDGEDLRRYLRRANPIAMAELRRIAIQACAAIAYIHDQGVIHRDIKPSNLFRTASGDIKLGDFGVALQTRDLREADTPRAAGTPLYMAPEQFRNVAVGVTADIYAFGTTMFQLVTGELPFVADSAMQLFHMHRSVAPPRVRDLRADAPVGLDLAIDSCLAKRPEDRPASMGAVLEALWG